MRFSLFSLIILVYKITFMFSLAAQGTVNTTQKPVWRCTSTCFIHVLNPTLVFKLTLSFSFFYYRNLCAISVNAALSPTRETSIELHLYVFHPHFRWCKVCGKVYKTNRDKGLTEELVRLTAITVS